MHHQIQPRQVDAARRHVRGDTDPRPTVPQSLQGMGPLGLAQLTRQGHNLKPTVGHARIKMADIRPRLAKHEGRTRLVEPQQVENCMFLVARRHRQRPIFDVAMLTRLALRHDPQGIALEGACQLFNLARDRC